MIRGVIFDMDGTILDSMHVWDKAIDKAVVRFGLTLTSDDFEIIEEMTQMQALKYVCKKYNLPVSPAQLSDETDIIIIEKYKRLSKPREGVLNVLQKLYDNNVKMIVATLASKYQAETVLEYHGMRKYLTDIITVDDVGKSKRNAEIYFTAAEKMDIKPSECLVFEDAPYAAAIAKKSGFAVCGVYENYYKNENELLKKVSDITIEETFDEILPFLEENMR